MGGAGEERKAVRPEGRGGVAEGAARLGEDAGENRGNGDVGYGHDDGDGKSGAAEEDAKERLLSANEKQRGKEIDKERLKEERGRRVLNSLDLVETLVSCHLPSLSPACCS